MRDNIVSLGELQESTAERWDTAYWCAAVATDSTGTATVTVVVPRRLTTWKIVAKGITQGSVAGETVETIVAEQELYGELKVPEALVPGDETEIIASSITSGSSPRRWMRSLAVSFAGKTVEQTHSVTVSASGRQELRFPMAGLVPDLSVAAGASSVEREHVATIRLTLTQGDVIDVVERRVPLQAPGVATLAAISGVAESNRTVTVDPPAGARRDSLRLRVSVRASVEGSLWDAVMMPQDDLGRTMRNGGNDGFAEQRPDGRAGNPAIAPVARDLRGSSGAASRRQDSHDHRRAGQRGRLVTAPGAGRLARAPAIGTRRRAWSGPSVWPAGRGIVCPMTACKRRRNISPPSWPARPPTTARAKRFCCTR